jgi:type IV pilus assembly protein PilA
MKNIKKIFKNQKGFTLVELIIVIAILAVIAAVAAPNMIGHVQSSRKSTDVTNANLIANAAITYLAEKGDTADTLSLTSIESSDAKVTSIKYYLQKIPKPQFKSGNFALEIENNGKIKVYIQSGSQNYEVYPEVHSDWQ